MDMIVHMVYYKMNEWKNLSPTQCIFDVIRADQVLGPDFLQNSSCSYVHTLLVNLPPLEECDTLLTANKMWLALKLWVAF